MIYIAQSIPDVTTFTVPSWASTDAGHAFFLGFALASVIRIIRACLRWFKRAGSDGGGGGGD
jgi:hypothetical protein